LKGPLPAGSRVLLVLTFRGADHTERSVTVQAPVSDLATGASGSKM
jgi:hypothetical protein